MGHHKKKYREPEPIQQAPTQGFDLSSMLGGMLRNLDINQVIGLLSNLAASPLAKNNSLNLGQLTSLFSTRGISSTTQSTNNTANTANSSGNANNTINIDKEKLNQIIGNLINTMNAMSSGMNGAAPTSSTPKEQES